MSGRVVLVQGGAREVCAPETARVPLLSGATRYGEGALEVLSACEHGPYLAHRHVARLRTSCRVLGLDAPASLELFEDLEALGPGTWRLRWTVCDDGSGATMRWLHGQTLDRSHENARCLAVQGRPSALGAAKTTSYAFARYALREARAHGLNDALAFEGERLLEGATSNVWVVRGGVVFAPVGDAVLAGITRQRLIELAGELGMEVRSPPVGELRLDDVRAADEVWLSSSVRGLRRVEEFAFEGGRRRFSVRTHFAKLRAAYEADRAADWGDARILRVPIADAGPRLRALGYAQRTEHRWQLDQRWELGVHPEGGSTKLFWLRTHPGGGTKLDALRQAFET